MLYEISFVDGSEAEYINLDTDGLGCLMELVDKYNKPFKLTPADNQYLTEYCFPVTETGWVTGYFTHHNPVFCRIKGISSGQLDQITTLRLLQSYFGDLLKDLDP